MKRVYKIVDLIIDCRIFLRKKEFWQNKLNNILYLILYK